MTSVTKALIIALPVLVVAACSSPQPQTATTATVVRPAPVDTTMQRTDQTMYQRSLRK